MAVKRMVISKERLEGFEENFEAWAEGIFIGGQKWRRLDFYDMKESMVKAVSTKKEVDYAIYNYSPHGAQGRLGKETKDSFLHGNILLFLCPFCIKTELNGEFVLYLKEAHFYHPPQEGSKGPKVLKKRRYFIREGKGHMTCKMCKYKIEWKESLE